MNLGRKRSQAEVVTKTGNLSASQRILRKIERTLISGWELRKAVLLAGTILSMPVFGLTACGKAAAETAGADTPAGAWTLVRMSYNGLTVEKEDLEDMDVSMALQLLEDGTGTMDYDGVLRELSWDETDITMDGVADAYTLADGLLTMADENMELVFARAAGNLMAAGTDGDGAGDQNGEDEGDDTTGSTDLAGRTGNSPSGKAQNAIEDNWTVVPLASSQALVPYSCTEFSMNIPQGWTVQSSPMLTGMYHAIRVFDPANPVNQVFFMLKMEPLFVSEDARTMMALYGQTFASYPVLTDPSTEGLFHIFPQLAYAIGNTSDYDSIQVPSIENFSVTEQFASSSGMSSVAVNPAVLRGTFTLDGMAGEGMFSADVVPFAMDVAGYYSAYNITVLSAAKDTFQDWEATLGKVLSSLQYTQQFVDFAMSQSNQSAATSQSLSQTASEMSDTIMSSWENRNKSQDIISQKQSDATLGYERIVDTETGSIYKIDNGFTDWYTGPRYKAVTDDQYTDEVEAVIHWK